MSLFACSDEAAECEVTCTTDTTSRRLKSTGNKPHHFRGHHGKKNHIGPRVNSPRTKSH
jgi:hypothetical protein